MQIRSMPLDELTRIRVSLRAQGVFRARDLHALGLTEAHVRRWTKLGFLERLGRGLYASRDVAATPDRLIVAAAVRAPRAVVCGPSAAHLHGLIDAPPAEVWMALPRKAWRPVVRDLPVRFVEMSAAAHGVGVETLTIEGAEVRIYGAAATVGHLVKCRRIVGEDAAAAALAKFMASRPVDVRDAGRTASVQGAGPSTGRRAPPKRAGG